MAFQPARAAQQDQELQQARVVQFHLFRRDRLEDLRRLPARLDLLPRVGQRAPPLRARRPDQPHLADLPVRLALAARADLEVRGARPTRAAPVARALPEGPQARAAREVQEALRFLVPVLSMTSPSSTRQLSKMNPNGGSVRAY